LWLLLFLLATGGAACYLRWKDRQLLIRAAIVEFPDALCQIPLSPENVPPAVRYRLACAILAKKKEVPASEMEEGLGRAAKLICDASGPDVADLPHRECASASFITAYLQPDPESPKSIQLRESCSMVLADDGGDLKRQCVTELRAVLEMRRRVQGAMHADTIRTWSNLGGVLYMDERFAEAEQEARAALAAVEKAKSPDDIETMRFRVLMARIMEKEKRFAEEEPLWITSLDILEHQKEKEEWQKPRMHYDLALCQKNLGKRDEASLHAAKALELLEAMKKPDSSLRAKIQKLMDELR
jgi:tetratricopeptide (TPR) repeat protein